MKFWKPAALSLALAMAYPSLAVAQSNAAMAKELKALQDRITELEKKLAEKPAPAAAVAAPVPAPADKQWGMTPEQLQDFNRIAVKTEATEDNLAAQGFKGLTVSGYIEPTYIYNKLQHRAGFQFLNNQSDGFFYDTSYMGAASIDFTKETDSGTRWKLTLAPNRGVGAAISGGIVQEASVSVPLTDLATRFIAGQIPDWSGYEYQQPTLNPFTSHNLLYDFTLPTSYTGAGMDVKTGKWEFANVNTTIRQAGEKSPAIAYRGDYSYSEYAGFGFAGLHGKTPNFNTGTSTVAHLLEADGYYTRGDWTFQGQVGVGMQKQGAITPDVDGTYRDANWWGLSGLAGYTITPRLQGLIRADYIHNTKNGGGLFGYNGYSAVCEPAVGATDCDGVPAGAVVYGNDGRNGLGPDLAGDLERGANRYALSFGMKFAFNPSTTFKAEYRLDGASKPVFLDIKDGTFHKTNQLFGASVVVFF
jgi:Protein of unknown function (DUF3138)